MSPTALPALSIDALPSLQRRGLAPAIDRTQTRVGVVHLGLGNFHRAHQAVHFADALARGDRAWAVSGWSLRSDAMRAALEPQSGLYTLLVRDHDTTRAQVITSIQEVGCASRTPGALINRLASPDTRIVTLTITEKGYCLDADGNLDHQDPTIAADLRGGSPPSSALGWLAAGLAARRAQAPGAALTVLSCDNLSANGATLTRALDQFLRARGESSLANWVAQRASFPNSMVDRIVPATTTIDREEAAQLPGLADAWPVATEPFSQWVIEDRFAAGRPRFDERAIQFSDDVAGWEQLKLRLLNAAHSVIAYLGVAAGWTTVDRAIANPQLAGVVRRLWAEEAIPALPASLREAAPAYCEQLLARFANPSLAHRTSQIAIDGSKKIPLRWLPTVLNRMDARAPWPCLALGLAAWIFCLAGGSAEHPTTTPDDPLAHLLRPMAADSDCLTAVRMILRAVPALAPLAAQAESIRPVAQALAALRAGSPETVMASIVRA